MKKIPVSLSRLGWAGLGKIAFDRFKNYVTGIQFYMILNFYLRDEGWKWWYLLLIPAGIVIIFFEIFYLYRGEQQAAFDVHPYMPKIRDGVERIEKQLEDLNRKLDETHRNDAKF